MKMYKMYENECFKFEAQGLNSTSFLFFFSYAFNLYAFLDDKHSEFSTKNSLKFKNVEKKSVSSFYPSSTPLQISSTYPYISVNFKLFIH